MCSVFQYGRFFCTPLISCFPGMLLSYYLSDCEMVSVAPIITGINYALYFYCEVLTFCNSLIFFLDHISVSSSCHIH